MKQELRNKSKYSGIKRIVYSCKYSLEGLKYAYRYEKSLWLHAGCSIVAILMGLLFKISLNQWSVLLISLGVILAFELVNTAVEAVVDMYTTEYHELAKIAKDCCSGATFVASMICIVITYVIFYPHILELLNIF